MASASLAAKLLSCGDFLTPEKEAVAGVALCLACVDAGLEQSGTSVAIATCANDPEQNWSEGAGHILQINKLCLGTAGGATASGTGVVLAACKSGATTQEWTQGTGNSLVNTGASSAAGQPVCLDDPGSSTSSGTTLDIAACNGGSNQAWPLPAAQGPPTGAPTGPVSSQLQQLDTQVPCLDDAGGKTTTVSTEELKSFTKG